MEHDASKAKLSLTALRIAEYASLLTKIGSKPISVNDIQEDLNSGAPSNSDGTINLVHYTAWLAREKCHGK